jgi:hypothetical protein
MAIVAVLPRRPFSAQAVKNAPLNERYRKIQVCWTDDLIDLQTALTGPEVAARDSG